MGTGNEAKSVAAVVLAAGSASRFGATKQLAELDGIPLVRRAVEAATTVCRRNTVVVLGHDWENVAAACAPMQGFIVFNDEYEEGLGGSIAHGVRAVRHVADAVIVMLADQALVSAEHLQAMCDVWSGADDEIVATAYADTFGVPALFPCESFDDLAALEGDVGARQLLTDRRFQIRKVNFEPAAVDVDTPEDLTRISRSARS